MEELTQTVPGFELGEELETALTGLAGKLIHLAEHGTDFHKLRHRDGFAILVDEQISSQRAMRVAAQGGGFFSAQGAEQFGEGRHAGEREPVLVRVGDAGLLLNGVGEIGKREALGLQFMFSDASGEGNRLEADPTGAIDVLQGQADNVADLVIVEAFDDGGDEDDLEPGALDVLDALELFLPQRLAARAAVDVVADAVELQVKRVQAGFLALLGECKVGEFQAVGGHLGVREAHLFGQAEDIQEARVDGGLAAGKLHDAAGDGALVAQRLEHFADGLEIRFVKVTRGVGVGETNRTGEIAAVSQVHVGQARMAGVQVAQAAIVRAAGGVGDDGVFQAPVIAEGPLLHLQIQFDVAVHDVAEVAMVLAVLLHDDLAAVFKDPGINQFRAIRAKRLGLFGQSLLQGLNGRAGIRSFGLYYLELCHDGPLYGKTGGIPYNRGLNGQYPESYGAFSRANGRAGRGIGRPRRCLPAWNP